MSLRQLPEIKAFDALSGLQLQFQPSEDDLSAFDPAIAAAETVDASISIYGTIGRDPVSGVDNSERRIDAALRAIGRKDVTVNLNSPGGSYFSGLAIYNLLRQHPAKVTVNVLGMAGSAASVIAMAGDEISMADASHIMVHKASALAMGNEYAMAEVIGVLREIDAQMAQLYAVRSGVETDVAAAWMDKNKGGGTRFYADEAIRLKLADRKVPRSAVKADAELSKSHRAETRIERALMRGESLTARDAKALIADLKLVARDADRFSQGARDAAHTATRDAGFAPAAVERLLKSLRS